MFKRNSYKLFVLALACVGGETIARQLDPSFQIGANVFDRLQAQPSRYRALPTMTCPPPPVSVPPAPGDSANCEQCSLLLSGIEQNRNRWQNAIESAVLQGTNIDLRNARNAAQLAAQFTSQVNNASAVAGSGAIAESQVAAAISPLVEVGRECQNLLQVNQINACASPTLAMPAEQKEALTGLRSECSQLAQVAVADIQERQQQSMDLAKMASFAKGVMDKMSSSKPAAAVPTEPEGLPFQTFAQGQTPAKSTTAPRAEQLAAASGGSEPGIWSPAANSLNGTNVNNDSLGTGSGSRPLARATGTNGDASFSGASVASAGKSVAAPEIVGQTATSSAEYGSGSAGSSFNFSSKKSSLGLKGDSQDLFGLMGDGRGEGRELASTGLSSGKRSVVEAIDATDISDIDTTLFITVSKTIRKYKNEKHSLL